MADDLTGTFGKPFKEAVAAFRLRLGNLVPTAKWDDIWQEQHDRAFMVAGATKADLLADLAAAVDKAISSGTSLEEFRRDFRRIVEERGWHGWTGEGTKGGEAWRTRVIYRTNIRTSYAAGRMAQLVDGGFTLWVYRHGGSVEPRIIHLGWDGLVLPPDHPFWATHAPPNGWGCSCYLVGARSFEGAQRLGGEPGKQLPDGWQKLDPKTGAPEGIDRGWAYAPGASAVDDIIAAVKGKMPSLPETIARDLAQDIGNGSPAVAPEGNQILRWQDWPATKTLGDVIRAALASGVAKNISLRPTLPVAGMREFLSSAAEATQRFDLPSLDHFAFADDLPFAVRGARKATAFYVPARRSMGVRQKAVIAAKVRANFDIEASSVSLARWRADLADATAEVQSRAKRMKPRRWSVVKDVRGIASHEYGHHLHQTFRSEIDALIAANNMIDEGWAALISEYARTNNSEFIAESFALYLAGGEDQHFRLHPALLAWLRKKEGKS